MKFKNPLLVVKDIDKSVDFYKKVLGLRVVCDFGENKTLTGGIALQTVDTFKKFIDNENILFRGNNAELYFEEDNFDAFIEKLNKIEIDYVHKVKQHSWGQRVVRFYDLDGHIIEVGESLKIVCKRFQSQNMSVNEIAECMDIPIKVVQFLLK